MPVRKPAATKAPAAKPRWGKQINMRVYADVLSASRDGSRLLVSCSAFRDVKVIGVADKKAVEFPAEIYGYAKGAALLPDGRVVRVGGGGTAADGVTHPGNLSVFDATGVRVASYEHASLEELVGVVVSPDGQWVAAWLGYGRSKAFLWPVEELLAGKKPRRTFDAGSDDIAAVDFAPDSSGLYRLHQGELCLLGLDGTSKAVGRKLSAELTATGIEVQGDSVLVKGSSVRVLSTRGTVQLALQSHLAEASCLADDGQTLLTAAGSLTKRYGKHESHYATPHEEMRDGFVAAWKVKGSKGKPIGFALRRSAQARAIACGQGWVAVGRDGAADLFGADEVRA